MSNMQVDCNGNSVSIKSKRLSDKFDHLIADVRSLIRDKLTNQVIYSNTFYRCDFESFMSEDFRVRRFLVKQNGSVARCVDSIISRLQWIKENKLREIDESHFPRESHLLGCLFKYERDLHGRPTLYNRLKLNVHFPELVSLKKLTLAYYFLKADDEAGEEGVTTITDLADTPWSAIEASLAKYLNDITKYFPYVLGEALIVNMPMFGNVFFSVIKYAFPSETRPRSVSKDDMTNFIDVNHLPIFLQGKCATEYCGPQVVPPNSPSIWTYLRNIGVGEKRIQEIVDGQARVLEMVAREGDWYTDDLITNLSSQTESA